MYYPDLEKSVKFIKAFKRINKTLLQKVLFAWKDVGIL